MKATLEFNLDDPDDKKAHMRCIKATDMAIVLFEIQNNVWRHKNNMNELMGDIRELYEANDINLDELID